MGDLAALAPFAARAALGWAATARQALATGPVALVTVLATEGSAPLGAGARMVVGQQGLLAGSVGGGALEWRALEQARAILAHAPGTWRVQDYPLGPLLGQCCGGRVRLLVERLDPALAGWLAEALPGEALEAHYTPTAVRRHVVPAHKAPPGMADARSAKPEAGAVLGEMLGALPRPVLLFGAGHVGQALERALAPLPFALHWFDTRPEFARPGVAIAGEDTLIAAITQAAPEAALLILTHDHGLDYRLASAALARPQGAPLFTGVIGSATKAARFRSRLGAQGLAAARLTCPIGLAGIGGKAPAVIAASVAAQLLMLESAPC